MKKFQSALALAAALALSAAPAVANVDTGHESQAQPSTTSQQRSAMPVDRRIEAFDTQVNNLTYTETENRVAAATYLRDATRLLQIAETALRANDNRQAMPALLGASGKLTYAYLDLNTDRDFANRIQPMTMQVQQALNMVDRDPAQSLAIVSSLTPEVASLYRTQLAQLGGGAGVGLEDLDDLDTPMLEEQTPMPEMRMQDETIENDR